uniref:Glucosidase 2 subunit beta n=1 Tax=Leptobrachium leishanense TaxID=445787 RepID=A0A8C5QDA4_9ANUR
MELFLLLVLGVLGSFAVEVKRPRGVSLSNRAFYDESKPFTCLDGSRTIPFDRVNDDYCDCADGTDEPGTAACSNGRFHCTNAGFKPQYIPASRVNDGVCDCCDTTDEYNSGELCQNTCREMGKKEREELLLQAEVATEGFRLKQQFIEEAKKSREESQTKLQDMIQQRQTLQGQVETLRAEKEEAEKPERDAKDTHKKAWEEQKQVEKEALEKRQALEAFSELDQDSDGMLTAQELLSHQELDSDGDGSLTLEEAQSILGGSYSSDSSSFESNVWPEIHEKYKSEKKMSTEEIQSIRNEENLETLPLVPGKKMKFRRVWREQTMRRKLHRDLKLKDWSIKQTLPPKPHDETELPPYDEFTQILIDAADKARSQFEEAEKSMKELEDTIRSLEKEVSLDFGPDGEFSYLYGQCYDLTTSEYVYRLCPFNRVTQKPKSGGSETNLGTWGSWAGPEDNKFTAMKYEQGTSCWQGPNRSTLVSPYKWVIQTILPHTCVIHSWFGPWMIYFAFVTLQNCCETIAQLCLRVGAVYFFSQVKLLCGKETLVTSTSEPSRCEYLMEFYTPAACHPPQALSGDHDEL